MSSFRLSRHLTAQGHRIYTVDVVAFGQLHVNTFLVIMGDPARPSYSALIDTGSAEQPSIDGIQAGLEAARRDYGEAWNWEGLSRIILTHPHPDHAGGCPALRRLTPAPVAAHRFALPYLQQPELLCQRAVPLTEKYLRWTGISEEYAPRFRTRATKWWVPERVDVQDVLRGGERLDGHFGVIHTPGHQGAQICLQLDEVLWSADQLLPRNLPPLMPEWLAPGHGLAHYLASLDKLEALSSVNIALGGHDQPMEQWRARIAAVRQKLEQKLDAVRQAARVPLSVQQLAEAINPRLTPLQAVLLLDQTAALVEYLMQRGELRAEGDAPTRFQTDAAV